MPYLKSLAEDAKLMQVFQSYPATCKPLIEMHEALMRGPSPFLPGERELIAAYVSGLNACRYCAGVHNATAAAFGLDENLLSGLLEDLEGAEVEAKLRPVLHYVEKLTRSPARMTSADAEAVFAAGWPEQALYDATVICGLYNLMNRMVDGLGIEADTAYFADAGQRLSSQGYAPIIEAMGKE